MPNQTNSTDILPVLRQELGLAVQTLRCAIYVGWWRLKHYVWSDAKFYRGAKITGAILAFAFFVEMVLFFFHIELSVWLGGLIFVLVIPTTGIIAIHKIEEAINKDREPLLRKHAEEVAWQMVKLSKVKLSKGDTTQALSDFIEEQLTKIVERFQSKINDSPNVMLLDTKISKLVIVYGNGEKKYPNELCFELGAGAAGFCYQETATVYIPRVRYSHGIIVTSPDEPTEKNGNRRPDVKHNGQHQAERKATLKKIRYGLKPRLYFPIDSQFENYQSILSIPIPVNGSPYAVLNVDSARPDAFKMVDIENLKYYAAIIGAGAGLCSTEPGDA